jgi:death-on-curing protein
MDLQSIDRDVLLTLHRACVAEYGEEEGLRYPAALDAALAYPMERAMTGDVDVAELAAAYVFGVLEQRPFIGANTRAAFLAMGLFLEMNGWHLSASDDDMAELMLEVAAGQMDESGLADWVRSRL